MKKRLANLVLLHGRDALVAGVDGLLGAVLVDGVLAGGRRELDSGAAARGLAEARAARREAAEAAAAAAAAREQAGLRGLGRRARAEQAARGRLAGAEQAARGAAEAA